MSFGILRRGAPIVAIAAAALLVAPAIAQAVGETYPPSDSYISVQPAATVAPGGTITLGFLPGSFGPGQHVSFTFTGESATAATMAAFYTAIDTLGTNKAAASDGSLSALLTLPATAADSYNLTAAVPGWARTWTFTVAGAPGDSALAANGARLNPLLWAWVAGGSLALVGGGLVVFKSSRKERKLTE